MLYTFAIMKIQRTYTLINGGFSMDSTIDKLIDDFRELSLNDQEYAVDIIRKQLIDAKRGAITKRAKEAMANLKKGMVKRGTTRDLYKDLESD